MGVLIIAEAGVNHNGSFHEALALAYAAKEAGADIVKYQHFVTDKLISKGTEAAPYQTANSGHTDMAEMVKGLELSLDQLWRLAEHCASIGIEFLCTPFDEDSAEALVQMGMKRIKIPSGEITNHRLIERYAKFKLPILLSTGASTWSEVLEAIDVIERTQNVLNSDITLLQCTSLYPAPPETMNLSVIRHFRASFGYPSGLSDHSIGFAAPIAAVALGATVIEKHFTLDTNLPGPDHAASMGFSDFRRMVELIRETEKMIGVSAKSPAAGEAEVAALVRRGWYAVRDLEPLHVLSVGDLALLRPARGAMPANFHPFGRVLASAVKAGDPLSPSSVEIRPKNNPDSTFTNHPI